MLLIGLGHKARHGKDTFANAVKSHFGDIMDIRLHSFADPLRAEVSQEAYRLWKKHHPGEAFNGRIAIKLVCEHYGQPYDPDALCDETYPWGKQRVLYQWWGTEYRRAQEPDYWVKKAQALIAQASREGANVVIFRDMRFHNEYDMIGSMGGYRVKISRLGFVSDVPQHISETELDDRPFDVHLGVGEDLWLLESLSRRVFSSLMDHNVRKQELLAA